MHLNPDGGDGGNSHWPCGRKSPIICLCLDFLGWFTSKTSDKVVFSGKQATFDAHCSTCFVAFCPKRFHRASAERARVNPNFYENLTDLCLSPLPCRFYSHTITINVYYCGHGNTHISSNDSLRKEVCYLTGDIRLVSPGPRADICTELLARTARLNSPENMQDTLQEEAWVIAIHLSELWASEM